MQLPRKTLKFISLSTEILDMGARQIDNIGDKKYHSSSSDDEDLEDEEQFEDAREDLEDEEEESGSGEEDEEDDEDDSEEGEDEERLVNGHMEEGEEVDDDEDDEEVESGDEDDDAEDEQAEEEGDDDEAEGDEQDEDQGDSDEDDDDEAEGDEADVESSEDEEDGEAVSGWADAMAKVLNTGKGKKEGESATEEAKQANLFLSKAKKDYERKAEVKLDADGKPIKVEEEELPKKKTESASVKRAKKKAIEEMCRSRPDIVRDRAREKTLQKIATKGVVQLFNAVREQQKTLKTQLNSVGNSVLKRDKVLKNIDKTGFLEVLSGGKKRKVESTKAAEPKVKKLKAEVKDEPAEDESTWKILRDDYMMGAKMKDWDKDSDGE